MNTEKLEYLNKRAAGLRALINGQEAAIADSANSYRKAVLTAKLREYQNSLFTVGEQIARVETDEPYPVA